MAKEEAHDCTLFLAWLGSRRRRRRVVQNVGDMGFKMVVALGRYPTTANIVASWRVQVFQTAAVHLGTLRIW